jgi:hypothetical protein
MRSCSGVAEHLGVATGMTIPDRGDGVGVVVDVEPVAGGARVELVLGQAPD